MGRLKKKFNWKARTAPSSSKEISTYSPQESVQLDMKFREDKYDATNSLVLPAVKPLKVTEKPKKVAEIKPLSKKQKKKLIKIVEKKKKKMNRNQLLEELQKVQATPEELRLMTSTSSMQTRGLKRHCGGSEAENSNCAIKVNSIKGSKYQIKWTPPNKKTKLSGNVVGFEKDSSDSDSSSEYEEISVEDHKELCEDKTSDTNLDEMLNNTRNTKSLKDVGNKSSAVDKELLEDEMHSSNLDKIQKDDTNSTESVKIIDSKPSYFVPVFRSKVIQASRELLPIYSEEQVIMEAIMENTVIVLCGETGSGKTTQVPQFLYEGGYTRNKKIIGVTEPRRVAAVTMSSRVAEELNLSGDDVSYQIRFEGNVTDETKIKFMTDGVLLKEIQNDFLLSKYSVIIIDEAHERSIFSDILIGLLSRIAPLRIKKGNPLKIIIMSATLRVEDFTQNPHLFKISPPVIKVDSRQYPVTIHFNKRTPEDYIAEAFKKVCKIHRQLPEGGILVFVTGQQEVKTLCKKLRKAFPFHKKGKSTCEKNESLEKTKQDGDCRVEELDKKTNAKHSDDVLDIKKEIRSDKKTSKGGERRKLNKNTLDLIPKINLDDYSIEPLNEEALQHQLSDEDVDTDDNSMDLPSDEEENAQQSKALGPCQPLYVLPLYSMLPTSKQMQVFKPPPHGTRLCVVATNVAETSLTIPALKYVVDTGKVKTRVYDKVSGISTFIITWTSKASANQRAGRAGRTGPGHCYRLYSSAVFNDSFPTFSTPEIQRRPVDDILLQMKALGIDKVVNFPFPSSPDIEALKAAERRLVMLGALEELQKPARFKDIKKWEWLSKVTPLGRTMACFPISPRYAKMLALAPQHNLTSFVIAIVAAMTVQEVFLDTNISVDDGDNMNPKEAEKRNKWTIMKKKWAAQGQSLKLGDIMVLFKAVGASEYVGCTPKFCSQYGLRFKAMVEIHKLRIQLSNEINLLVPETNLFVDPKMEPPNDFEIEMLRQIVTTGMTDHVARRIPETEIKDEDKIKLKNAYQCLDLAEPVFIHTNSVLHDDPPPFIVYQEIFETSKLFMRMVAAIEPEWLPLYAPKQCVFSKPLDKPPPHYDSDQDKIMCYMTSTFGQWSWMIPPVELEMPQGFERYNWFCYFLLEGQVCPLFKKYKGVLLSPPATMIKSWAKLQPRTQHLLQAVVLKQVDSRTVLCKVWETDSNYLFKEYCEWLPQALHFQVQENWPPIR